jgi:general secretion pathway protein A
MYTAFYGLREKPFALSPDPRFLYLAASHREALAHLLYGIEQGEGFISVTGEVGTGKTTLCRTLLERLEGDIELAFLFHPSKSALELLQSICAEFGLPAEGLGRRNLMSQLNKFLLEQKERGRRVLLIIDEAQTLSENTLEQVRLLSNLETSREKLIQILLLGQPELDRKLDERGLRQLRQRISVRWKLEPLSAAETLAYVRHRISVAAGEPKDLFSEAALRDVHRRTGGIPRLVNQLCDRALLAGYATRAAQIGPALIRAAAREIPDVRDPGDRDPRLVRKLVPTWMKRPWMYFALTLGGVGLALVTGLLLGRSSLRGGAADPAASLAADASTMPPAVSARGATGPPRPPLGRLIGYVATNPSGDGGSAPAELRATDGQLAAAGVGLAGTPGLRDPLAAAVPLIGRSAIAAGLLPEILAERPSDAALAESERAFLDLYDLPSEAPGAPPATADALAERLEARGLMATAFEGGSFEMLRRLDHPVLIPIALDRVEAIATRNGVAPTAAAALVPESDRRWLALTGFDGDRAWLAGLVPGRVVSVAVAELEPHWLEAGVLVWKNHESLAARFEQGGERESIEWLQNALAELQLYPGSPTGQFDAKTADALRDFQSRTGLTEDGVVGPLTQIALYAELPRYPVPRLSASAVRPPPALPPVSAGPERIPLFPRPGSPPVSPLLSAPNSSPLSSPISSLISRPATASAPLAPADATMVPIPRPAAAARPTSSGDRG